MSANGDLITVETLSSTRETIENQFFIYIGQNVYIFGYLKGPVEGGGFNYQTGPILPSSYPLTHIYVHVK